MGRLGPQTQQSGGPGLVVCEEGVACFGNLYGQTEQEENIVSSFSSIEGFPVSAVSDRDELKGHLEMMYPRMERMSK